jgi:hypothetical protein
MHPTAAEEFETRAAGLVHMLLVMEEEQRPLPEDPSPAMLLARVTERLGQAALAAMGTEGENADESLLQTGVFLLGTSAFAITAIAHIVEGEPGPTEIKDKLLSHLDEEVAEAITAEKMESGSAGEFVGATLASLVGACQCVAELEGVNDLVLDESEDDADQDEETIDEVLARIECVSGDEESDEDEDESLIDQIIDSLGQAAVMAAAAGQTLIERSER